MIINCDEIQKEENQLGIFFRLVEENYGHF